MALLEATKTARATSTWTLLLPIHKTGTQHHLSGCFECPGFFARPPVVFWNMLSSQVSSYTIFQGVWRVQVLFVFGSSTFFSGLPRVFRHMLSVQVPSHTIFFQTRKTSLQVPPAFCRAPPASFRRANRTRSAWATSRAAAPSSAAARPGAAAAAGRPRARSCWRPVVTRAKRGRRAPRKNHMYIYIYIL